MPARRQQHEAAEQQVLVQWMRYKGLLFFHCPNGGRRRLIDGIILQKMGVSPGVPDILCMDPPPKIIGKVGFAIELKAPHSLSKGTPEQKAWLANLAQRNWAVGVFAGANKAIYALEEAGY